MQTENFLCLYPSSNTEKAIRVFVEDLTILKQDSYFVRLPPHIRIARLGDKLPFEVLHRLKSLRFTKKEIRLDVEPTLHADGSLVFRQDSFAGTASELIAEYRNIQTKLNGNTAKTPHRPRAVPDIESLPEIDLVVGVRFGDNLIPVFKASNAPEIAETAPFIGTISFRKNIEPGAPGLYWETEGMLRMTKGQRGRGLPKLST